MGSTTFPTTGACWGIFEGLSDQRTNNLEYVAILTVHIAEVNNNGVYNEIQKGARAQRKCIGYGKNR